MAIRIFSFDEAMRLKDRIPRIVLAISKAFQGDGYDPERDGYLVVLEPNDDITTIKEIGEDGLFADGMPNFEYVQTFLDGDSVCMEIVLAVDADRTIAIFAKQNCLDPTVFSRLQMYSSPIQPMPQEVLP